MSGGFKARIRHQFSTIRVHLISIVVLCVLPAFALTLYNASQERQLAREQSLENLRRLTKVVAVSQSRVVEGARQLLSALAGIVDNEHIACDRYLAELMQANPVYASLNVADAQGNVLCSGQARSAPFNIADRPYFRRVLATRDFVIGEYQVGRVTGIPQVAFAYPILDENQSVTSVIVAGFNINAFANVLNESELPNGASIKIADKDGTILNQYPANDSATAKKVVLPENGSTQTQGDIVSEISTYETSTTLVAVATVGDTLTNPLGGKLMVVVEMPRDAVQALAKRNLFSDIALIIFLVFFMIPLAWYISDRLIARKVRTLVQATNALAAGNFDDGTAPLRNDHGEFGQLAMAIDQMASAINLRQTQLANAITSLKASEEQYRELFESNPHPMWVFDLQNLRFLAVNIEAVTRYGYSADEFLSMRIPDIRPMEDTAVMADLVFDPARPLPKKVTRHLKKDGSIIDVELTRHVIRFEGRPAGLVLARDVTQTVQAAERAVYLAYYDEATGLPNRARFNHHTDFALKRATRVNRLAALILLDIDRLASINREAGRKAGDICLSQVATLLAQTVPDCLCARLGSDEFAILVEDLSDAAEAYAVARRLQQAVYDPAQGPSAETALTISAGISVYPADAAERSGLLKQADLALRQAKRAGKNSIRFFEAPLNVQDGT